jgi:hypothetical protein
VNCRRSVTLKPFVSFSDSLISIGSERVSPPPSGPGMTVDNSTTSERRSTCRLYLASAKVL